MFKLTIATDNDAFVHSPGEEVARILAKIASRLKNGDTAGHCIDANGNRVGEWELDHEESDDSED